MLTRYRDRRSTFQSSGNSEGCQGPAPQLHEPDARKALLSHEPHAFAYDFRQDGGL